MPSPPEEELDNWGSVRAALSPHQVAGVNHWMPPIGSKQRVLTIPRCCKPRDVHAI